MQELRRIVKIVANNTPKVLPVIDPEDNSSLEGRLYHLIKHKEVLTDEEACLLLYGENKLTPSYRMLKSRLRKKLLNNLFFIELSESHIRKSTILHTECFSLIQQATNLIALNEYSLAGKLAEQAIVIAQKAELNDILVKAYEIKLHSVSASNNRSKFNMNFEMLQRYSSVEGKEREATITFFKLNFEVNLNITANITAYRKQSEAYKKALPQLRNLWESTGSSKIFDFYHLMRVSYRELLGDYEGILEAIEEAESLLAEGRLNNLWFNERFNNFIKVYAYLRLGKLDEGLYYSELHLKNYKEGSNNWLAFLENYVILAVHKRNYHLAVELYLLAQSKTAFSFPRMQEMWGLIGRYLNLISMHAKSFGNNVLALGEHKLSLISKDKEGYNLPVLILEYLEAIPKLDAEDMEQYSERFSNYASKYLKGDVWVRVKLFIKLLILSMKEKEENLEEKAAPLLKQLKSIPPPRDPVAEVEIIPYEHLWELVLNLVQQRVKQ